VVLLKEKLQEKRSNMYLDVGRFADNGKASLSYFQINGVSYTFGIEDEGRDTKVAGETRIPEGTYKVALRAEGGYHNREAARYKDKKPGFHRGMLAIYNAPDWKVVADGMEFQYILIHPGNTEKHTNGCYLPNMSANFSSYEGGSSRVAYEKIYPIIRDAILAGEDVTITYKDVEPGR
jgi:hypothetical protein